jgi:hypothetical protein
MMRIFLLSLLLATLGNADIVKLVKAGLSAETIETKIESSQTGFDTSTDALVALAKEGVPDRVIRKMIEHDHAVPPAPPAPPAPVTPPAPPAPPAVSAVSATPAIPPVISRRYDVTVLAENGGKCDAELRIDSKAIKASRCRTLDFDIAWRDVERVCHRYGFRGEVTIKTKDRERRIATVTPAEAKRLVDHIRSAAPKVAVAECD